MCRVVFCNQPLAYREAMACVVQALRPAVAVSVSDPRDLEAEIARLAPQLVIGSDLSESIRAGLLAWVTLYPDGENVATCGLNGVERCLPGVDLSGLLALVDEVVGRCQSMDAP